MIQTFLKEIFHNIFFPDVKSTKNMTRKIDTSKASPLQYKRLPPAISLKETDVLMPVTNET
jgi:hypothetical protein